ncbi:MAG: glutaredoxin family protein [Anaerolineae bacterium]|nr:glutaredoxin family protein [Anaerolineae bacterium]
MKQVHLYALSTCGWCRKARHFLEDNDIEHECTYVDQLKGAERDEVMRIVRQWNPKGSFPTIVVADTEVIVGFKEDRLREVLEL